MPVIKNVVSLHSQDPKSLIPEKKILHGTTIGSAWTVAPSLILVVIVIPSYALSNRRLKNRKAAEQKLGAFLDNLAVPAGLIEGIVQREVDDDYQVPFHAL